MSRPIRCSLNHELKLPVGRTIRIYNSCFIGCLKYNVISISYIEKLPQRERVDLFLLPPHPGGIAGLMAEAGQLSTPGPLLRCAPALGYDSRPDASAFSPLPPM